MPAGEQPRDRLAARALAHASAPLLGARPIFPARFDQAFEAVRSEAETAAIIPEHAFRFFGDGLKLAVPASLLTHRISDWVRDGHGRMHWTGAAFLDGAVWDAAVAPVEESPVDREMRQTVAADGHFRRTRAYRGMRRRIRKGRFIRRNRVSIATIEQLDAYFEYCRDLIDSVRSNGVIRRGSSEFDSVRLTRWRAIPAFRGTAERDIGVGITAKGELIRVLGGKHRTAIAQALDLAAVPVEVRLVHTAWLARQIERTGLPPHQALLEALPLIV